MQVTNTTTNSPLPAPQMAARVETTAKSTPDKTNPVAPAKMAEIAESASPLGKNKVNSQRKRPKQIPTILALIILVISLVAGISLFGEGTGVFAPRATPQTTPKNMILSNITDKSFTVSFYTDEETVAFIEYGENPDTITQRSGDDRDQLSGLVGAYRLHHITVRGLKPGLTYHFKIGTGTNSFDNNGEPYQVLTALQPGNSPSSNQTVYGIVNLGEDLPAEGSIVYVSNSQMNVLSSLVKESGSWGISLATAFTPDGKSYANLLDTDQLKIKVQGVEPSQSQNFEVVVADAQPVTTINLASADLQLAEDLPVASMSEGIDKDELLAGEEEASLSSIISSDSAALTDLEASSATGEASTAAVEEKTLENQEETQVISSETIVDLEEVTVENQATSLVVESSQPVIKAKLVPNVTVKITVNSETQIERTLQTDEGGNINLDIATLGESLEPGEHSVSYSYIDPETGEEVIKTYNFTVAPESVSQLAAAPTATPTPMPTLTPTSVVPYGSGNPYLPTPTPTVVSVEATESASPAAETTRSAVVATASGEYDPGSVGNTFVLLMGALFFVGAGIWSFKLSGKFESEE